MNTRTSVVAAGLLVCLGAAVPAAHAQGKCRLSTFTGTYVFHGKGSSAILDPDSQPYPFHWAGALAPFVTVGAVTMGPGGIGQGFFWIRLGSLNGGLDPLPVDVTVTELNEDCTGKFSYSLNIPGGLSPTIEERFVLFDNGREYRSIPSSIVDGIPTLAWIAEGHRISKPAEPLDTCGPHTANGTHLIAAENLVRFGVNPIFADTLLLRVDVSMTGDFTGILYEKLGPTGDIELPAWGTIRVNPDCSFAMTLNLLIQGLPAMAPVRGVFFDQGKRLYGLNMNDRPVGTQFSFAEGRRIGP